MCNHILNAQVQLRAPCCRKWYDCSDCHREKEQHALLQRFDLTLVCKKCKKCFRKDMRAFEDCDEYCPHCDNHYLLDAKLPQSLPKVESTDIRVEPSVLKDYRVEGGKQTSTFDPDNFVNRLG